MQNGSATLSKSKSVEKKSVQFNLIQNQIKSFKWTEEQKLERREQIIELLEHRKKETQRKLKACYDKKSIREIARTLALNHCVQTDSDYDDIIIDRFIESAILLKSSI